MMNSMRIKVLAIMLVAVVVLAVGETLLSKGLKQVGHGDDSWHALAIASLGNVWVGVGCGLLALHLLLYMVVLSQADLSFALPLTAGSYPIAAVLSKIVLHENVGTARWLGTALITLGVAIVSAGDGPTAG
jgi:uncharacterized membrane protein